MAIIIDIFTKQVIIHTTGYDAIRQNIIARFFGDGLPKHFKACIAKPQKQPYMHGDVSNVSYRKKLRAKHTIFNSPTPVPCEVTIDSCVKVDGILTLGSQCELGIDEPFPWMDHKYGVSLSFLKSLPDGTELNIFTRSDLIAHDDYMPELKRLNVTVSILYMTKDDQVNRVNEPGAPSYKRRSIAVERLKSLGINARLKRHNKSFKMVG